MLVLSRPASIKLAHKCVSILRILLNNFASQNTKMSENIETLIKQLVPPLSFDKHKGQAGRIGVFGGSLEYTGAPYFAAITSLKVGADLSHVFCAKEAAPVIKSYSPELIVHPLLDVPSAALKIEPWLDRLHVVLIGPGLGREQETFKVVDEVLALCRARRKPLVIDADGLYYVSINPNILKNYPSPVVLTPNVMEFARLVGSSSEGEKQQQAGSFLALAPDITVLCKGRDDEIFNRNVHVKVTGGGSARRCGGQGDLLSGALTTFLAWALQKPDGWSEDRAVIAAYAACKLARGCNERAFAKFRRSMTCTNMITEIHETFEELFENK